MQISRRSPEQYRVTQQGATQIPGKRGASLQQRARHLRGHGFRRAADRFVRQVRAGDRLAYFARRTNLANINERPNAVRGGTEVRSAQGDSQLGPRVSDGPTDCGGLRYCMNWAALRFVHPDVMAAERYAAYLDGWTTRACTTTDAEGSRAVHEALLPLHEAT
jgi:hypothetical protein